MVNSFLQTSYLRPIGKVAKTENQLHFCFFLFKQSVVVLFYFEKVVEPCTIHACM